MASLPPVNNVADVLFCRLSLRIFIGLAEHIRKIEGHDRLLQSLGLELVYIQNIIQHGKHVIGDFPNLSVTTLLHFRIIRIMLRQIQHTENTVHRCTNIMAHVGKEARLCRSFLCLLHQALLLLFAVADAANHTKHMGDPPLCVSLLHDETHDIPVSVFETVFIFDILCVSNTLRQRGHIRKP